MSSLKFTKETIEVGAGNIKVYADEIIQALKDNDLDQVDALRQRIEREADNIGYRLYNCDEY